MKNSECEYIEEELTAYCYGELDPLRAETLESHLMLCAKCTSEVKKTREALSLINGRKLKRIPSEMLLNYEDEIMLKLDKKRSRASMSRLHHLEDLFSGVVVGIRSILSPWKFIPAVVVLCVLLFAFSITKDNIFGTTGSIDDNFLFLEQLGISANDIYLDADSEVLAEAIRYSDTIVLAQLDADPDLEELLSDLELLQALDEELGDDTEGLFDELELLYELETATA